LAKVEKKCEMALTIIFNTLQIINKKLCKDKVWF